MAMQVKDKISRFLFFLSVTLISLFAALVILLAAGIRSLAIPQLHLRQIHIDQELV